MTDEELRQIIDPVSSTLPLSLLPTPIRAICVHTKLAFPAYIERLQGS